MAQQQKQHQHQQAQSQQQQQSIIPSDMIPPHQQTMHHPVSSYYPETSNDLTGGLPINLDSLRDGPPGSKPFYPYSTLIRFVVSLLFTTHGRPC